MKNDELELLYCQYMHQVYLYALALCKNHHLAEELTSDTFYKAILSLNGNESGIQYRLLRICRNLFLDHCRRCKNASLPLGDMPLVGGSDPLETIIQNETYRRLYQALLLLSPADREILTMFYFAHCNLSKIAALTMRTPGAVKTALSRARQRLRKILEDE